MVQHILLNKIIGVELPTFSKRVSVAELDDCVHRWRVRFALASGDVCGGFRRTKTRTARRLKTRSRLLLLMSPHFCKDFWGSVKILKVMILRTCTAARCASLRGHPMLEMSKRNSSSARIVADANVKNARNSSSRNRPSSGAQYLMAASQSVNASFAAAAPSATVG